jgi:hypothetical protein
MNASASGVFDLESEPYTTFIRPKTANETLLFLDGFPDRR